MSFKSSQLHSLSNAALFARMTIWFTYIIAWIFVLCPHVVGDKPQCNPEFHNTNEVQSTVLKAQTLLNRFPTEVAIKDRLAVMILLSRGFHPEKGSGANRLNHLNCALIKFQKMLGSTTPHDIYIWVLNTTKNPVEIPLWLNATAFPRVNVIEIPEITWTTPCRLLPDSKWNLRRKFDLDYYLMGRWRLTFSLDFARAMGYDYHLQFDDDAIMMTPINYNLIAKLREGKYDVATSSDLYGEVAHIANGLAELTRFWLRFNHFQVRGNLFEKRFHKGFEKSTNGLSSDSFDRYYHPGYFFLIRLEWWYSEHPQSYLETILRSGKDIEARWQEQLIMNMMQYVFVPEQQLLVLDDPGINHDRHKKQNFQDWCVAKGIPAIYPL